jgi:hypothetical protein
MLFVALTQSIGDADCNSWLKETEIIIASIPKDDIGLLLRLSQDHLIINACVQEISFLNMKFIFLEKMVYCS